MKMRGIRAAVILALALGVMATEVEDEFNESHIVPDVIPVAPPDLVTVNYPTVEIQLGNLVNLTQVQQQPTVSWDAKEGSLYTLALFGVLASFDHWLVVNIPGQNITAGDTLASYIGSIPPPLLGAYRYVFLVYEQPSRIDVDPLSKLVLQLARILFSIANFAAEHNLGDPIAGNFYLCQFDLQL